MVIGRACSLCVIGGVPRRRRGGVTSSRSRATCRCGTPSATSRRTKAQSSIEITHPICLGGLVFSRRYGLVFERRRQAQGCWPLGWPRWASDGDRPARCGLRLTIHPATTGTVSRTGTRADPALARCDDPSCLCNVRNHMPGRRGPRIAAADGRRTGHVLRGMSRAGCSRRGETLAQPMPGSSRALPAR